MDGELLSDILAVTGRWAALSTGGGVGSTTQHDEQGGGGGVDGDDGAVGVVPPPTPPHPSLTRDVAFALYGDRGTGKTGTLREVQRSLLNVYGTTHCVWVTYQAVVSGIRRVDGSKGGPTTTLPELIEDWEADGQEVATLPSAKDGRQAGLLLVPTVVIFIDDLPLLTALLRRTGGGALGKLKQLFRGGGESTTSGGGGAEEGEDVDAKSVPCRQQQRIFVISASSRNDLPAWFTQLFPAPVQKTLAPSLSPSVMERSLVTEYSLSEDAAADILNDCYGVAASPTSSRAAVSPLSQSDLAVVALGLKTAESRRIFLSRYGSEARGRRLRHSGGPSSSSSSSALQQQQRPQALPRLHGYEDVRSRLKTLIELHISRNSDDDDVSLMTAGGSGMLGPVARAVPPTTGILLHGPPGCGKTSIIQEVGRLLPSARVVFVKATRLFSKYLGDSEAKFRQAFAAARAQRPSILVIDDIDTIAVARAEGGEGKGLDVTVRMLSALLCEMDGVEDSRGVLVVGTTSRLHAIDKALLRQGRLETLLEVPFMRDDDVEAIVDAYMSPWIASPSAVGPTDTDDSSSREEDTAAADGEAVGATTMMMRSRLVQECRGCAPSVVPLIFRTLLETALGRVVPSHTSQPTTTSSSTGAGLLDLPSLLTEAAVTAALEKVKPFLIRSSVSLAATTFGSPAPLF